MAKRGGYVVIAQGCAGGRQVSVVRLPQGPVSFLVSAVAVPGREQREEAGRERSHGEGGHNARQRGDESLVALGKLSPLVQYRWRPRPNRLSALEPVQVIR